MEQWILRLALMLGLCGSVPMQAAAATRLGLHVTQEELTIWQARAVSGPYKTAGDVSTNSPGDWTRITANAALASSTGRWTTGPTILLSGTNCVAGEGIAGLGNYPPQAAFDWAARLRDAAFSDLVLAVTTHQATVKAELLWLAQQAWANFGSTTHWCTRVLNPGLDTVPSQVISTWVVKLLFAYDYLGRSAFSTSDLAIMDAWFWTAADYFRIDYDNGMDSVYPNRWTDSDAGAPACVTDFAGCSAPAQVTYTGGPTAKDQGNFNNNRRGAVIASVGLFGVYLSSHGFTPTTFRSDNGGATLATVLTSAKLFAKEWVRRSLIPDGSVHEMCRGDAGSLPDLGWGYAGTTLGEVVVIADHFARNGDTTLYTYNTAAGVCNGTAGSSVGTINDGGARVGQNKDLLFGIQALMKYPSDTYARYLGTIGNLDARIDGRHPRNGTSWSGTHDTYLIPGNIYYNDAFVKSVYTRQLAGTVAYPASVPSSPGTEPWTGENGIYPGILFMFGQMEGIVDPYGTSPPLSPPQNVRIVIP